MASTPNTALVWGIRKMDPDTVSPTGMLIAEGVSSRAEGANVAFDRWNGLCRATYPMPTAIRVTARARNAMRLLANEASSFLRQRGL